jgi:hypothetical protein
MSKLPAPDDQEPARHGGESPDLIRDAVAAGWGRTARLCMVLMARGLPAVLAIVLTWLLSRH